jgi:group II intron reverse transcriptase/maturase
MKGASTLEEMSPELQRVAERARREPEGKFHSLAHLIDEKALTRAYQRLKKDAAVGVDGVTKEKYGEDLERNLRDLHARLKAMTYRHQPIRRVHVPKGNGKTRPIGISATEDKVVQGALSEVLGAVYEQVFSDCSYGFRPGRSAHDAMRALDKATKGGQVSCILEADIGSFFDSLDRKQLREMIQARVPDGSLWRLIGKCLHAGVLDGEEFSSPEVGTAQGSVLSPMLGNIYLHHVLDVWFAREVRPRLKGEATLVRYADDFVIAFQYREDAERVYDVLGKRMQRFGLTLHPEKTRLIPFDRPPQGTSGKGPATFDFLGFTWYWRRSRKGWWTVAYKTRTARLTRAITAVADFCRSQRHEPVKTQHEGLCRRLLGHFNYFGVNGNARSLHELYEQVRRRWYKWLRRRSQRTRLNWERYHDMLRDYPLPAPRVAVRIWGQ